MKLLAILLLFSSCSSSMVITLNDEVNPITGDTIPSGTILPCKAKHKTGDIIYVKPSIGDMYVEDSVKGIKGVFIK